MTTAPTLSSATDAYAARDPRRPRGARDRVGDRAGPHRLRVGLRGIGPRADDRRPRRRHARRAPREQPARAHDASTGTGCACPRRWTAPRRCSASSQPGERFDYRFELPDAGTFWYHSHANETVQIERGLYGALVVLGPDEPAFDADRLLVLDDVKLDRHGSIAKTALIDRHSGREGKRARDQRPQRARVRDRGGTGRALAHRERLQRALRAAVARRSALPHHRRRWRVARRRRHGRPRRCSRPAIASSWPSARSTTRAPSIAIESLPYRRTAMKRPRRDRWGTLRVGPRAPSVASIPAALATIEPLVPAGPIQPTRTVRLGARMTLHGHDWLINGETHHHDAPVKVGELQVWELVNETGMDHPFHLHGFFFQVVAIDGAPTVPRSWEDTVNVAAKRRVTIAFRPDDRPGRVDVPLPHPRAPRGGDDGSLRGGALRGPSVKRD